MKIKFKKILSALLIAATAKVTANPSIVDGQSETKNSLDNEGNQISVKDKKRLLQKYIIKFGSDNSYVIAGHRSHRSHSSHRSHRSSSSGGYDYTPSKSSNRSSNTTTSKSLTTRTLADTSSKETQTRKATIQSTTKTLVDTSSKEEQTRKVTTQSTTKTLADTSFKEKQTKKVTTQPTVQISTYIYKLGDRTISSGTCGTDVKILAALLVRHGFLGQKSVETNPDGYPICNAPMVAAIKSFQKTIGLATTGSADEATIRALRDQDKNN